MNKRSATVFALLVGLGCLQMAADVLGMSRVKGFAAATQVAPAMKVFTAHGRYEAYAQRFFVDWHDSDGTLNVVEITPERYARVRGPYNRRNVYGAAFAAGPIIRADSRTRDAHESLMRYALCTPGVLREELDIPAETRHLVVRVLPLGHPPEQELELVWEVTCES